MSTEPMTRRGTVFQKPSLILVCVRIWDGVRAAETNVSRKLHRRWCCGRTSIQKDFLGCSGGRVVHNLYCEAELVLARVPLVEGSGVR